MNYTWRVRIDRGTLSRADQVAKRLGTTMEDVVRELVTRIARTGSVPREMEAAEAGAVAPWEFRAETLERFYHPFKAW